MTYKLRRGYFEVVNGLPVVKHGGGLPLTSWTVGYPKAVLWHYTAGCGSDIHDVLKSRGISVTFGVDREGQIYQYAPLGKACWHAFSMSHYAVGIEHTVYPGTCEVTDIQLAASAKLSAGILELVKKRHNFEIPLKKLPSPVTLANVKPGFFDHRDGDHSWNENGHTDHLVGESWTAYLDAVKDVLVPALRFEVTARKGTLIRTRTFGKLREAIAYSREMLKKTFRVRIVPKGPAAGPEG